jgi:hypothetical protein
VSYGQKTAGTTSSLASNRRLCLRIDAEAENDDRNSAIFRMRVTNFSIATLRPESVQSRDLITALECCASRMGEGGVVFKSQQEFRGIPFVKIASLRLSAN